MAVGDLDGDGSPDFSLITSSSLALLRNTTVPANLTNSFAPPVLFPGANYIALGDVDGDGKPDVATVATAYNPRTHIFTTQLSLLKNTSTPGSLTTNSLASPVAFSAVAQSQGLAIGDLNGDGRPDVVVAKYSSGGVSIFPNATPLQPVITTQPTNQVVIQGSNATFTVTATGSSPLGYQWKFNETNLSGATSTSCTLTNTSLANAGGYSVMVTNPFGSVESLQATLTVVSTNWLAQYFGANYWTNASAGLFADPDGDGVLNWQEYVRGQNPVLAGTVADTSNAIKVQVYTPLK